MIARSFTIKLIALAMMIVGISVVVPAQDEAVAIFNAAQDVHAKGDIAGAISLYTKALESLPEFPEAEYQRASAYLSLGNRADAEKGFRRALELRVDWTLAQASLGSLLVTTGKLDEAEPLLASAVGADPQNAAAVVALADLRLRKASGTAGLSDVLRRLTDLSAKANQTAEIWNAKAAVETALKKRSEAGASLMHALRLDAYNRSSLIQMARLSLLDGDLNRARGSIRALEEKGHKGADITILKAELLASDGKADQALKLLDTIDTPDDSVAALRKAILSASSTSAGDLEKQLASDPKNPSVLGRLCSLYRRDDPVKALDFCRRANELEPSDPTHAIGFAAALVQAKQYGAAVDLLGRIVKIVPDNSTVHANLGTALFQSGRYAEAKSEFEWLISKQPGAPAPYFFLAFAHDHLREFVDAVANYQAYLRLADPVENKFDIERVKLRLPSLEKELRKLKKND